MRLFYEPYNFCAILQHAFRKLFLKILSYCPIITAMLQANTLKFLKDLAKNNDKAWFDAHRIQYEEAKIDFENFIQSVLDKYSKNDQDLVELTAKKCTFRINRDVRFSKDKSPYKSNFGASMNRGGKKSILPAIIFIANLGKALSVEDYGCPCRLTQKK